MTTPAEQQLATLIDAAVKAAVAKTTEQFATLFTDSKTRLDQLAAKNAELLSEKKALEGKPAIEKRRPIAEVLAEFEAETEQLLAKVETTDYTIPAQKAKAADAVFARHVSGKTDADGAIVLDRNDPRMRSGTFYREQRARAEKLGVPLRIVDTGPTSGSSAQQSPIRKSTFDHRSTRYVHKDEIAGQQFGFRERARKDGMRVVVFRDETQIPDDAMQAYRAEEDQ